MAKKIYGIIGYPVKHSFSPAMHNAAFKVLNLDAEYELFEIKPEELPAFLNSLKDKEIFGLNVTVPHKEKALLSVELDEKNSHLKKIGAINTILRKNGKIKGFNTDIEGFRKHLKENLDPAHKRVAILGAGGASRAVSFVLAEAGAAEIALYDIDKLKSDNITQMIKELFPVFNIYPVGDLGQLNLKNKNLLINATPLGLKDDDPFPIEENYLHKDLFVYDLIYNPTQTKLLKLAKNIGAKTSNGLGMLLYQGMASFEIWTQKPAPKEVMQKALLEAIKT